MATKLQLMSELSVQTTKKLTHSIDDWLSFLDSAAWLYKYPFPEQVLIHAQRPDARACASMELWNSPRFNRWVNKGAKGIALIDDSGEKTKLRYVFDVSDTNSRYNIPFSLWQQKEQDEDQIIEELSNHFGEPNDIERYSFPEQLIGIIHNAVADNSTDYARELLYMFTEFNACFRRGYDRSNGRMTVSFGDELGNDLTFILSREEIEYFTAGVTEKLDNLVCDSFAPYDGDDAEESTIRLTPVNTEKELDMLLAHVLGDDGGGADD